MGAQFFCQRRDDGGDLEFQRFRDALRQATDDVAHFTDIYGVALFIFFMDAFPNEDFRAGNAYALAAVVAEHLNQTGIDGSGKGAFHDGNGFRSRDAKPVDETGFQPCLRHRLGNGFASAVDNHGVEAQDFQQNDVPHELLDQAGVIHGTAAEFDEECFVPVGLEVGEGADNDGGLFNQAGDFGVHVSNETVRVLTEGEGYFEAGPVQSRRLLLK